MNISFEQANPWHFIVVYGSPQITSRNQLWEGLRNISNQVQGEWCVGGDFNSILSLNDTGGSANLSRDSLDFYNCLLDCGLQDNLSLGKKVAFVEDWIVYGK